MTTTPTPRNDEERAFMETMLLLYRFATRHDEENIRQTIEAAAPNVTLAQLSAAAQVVRETWIATFAPYGIGGIDAETGEDCRTEYHASLLRNVEDCAGIFRGTKSARDALQPRIRRALFAFRIVGAMVGEPLEVAEGLRRLLAEADERFAFLPPTRIAEAVAKWRAGREADTRATERKILIELGREAGAFDWSGLSDATIGARIDAAKTEAKKTKIRSEMSSTAEKLGSTQPEPTRGGDGSPKAVHVSHGGKRARAPRRRP